MKTYKIITLCLVLISLVSCVQEEHLKTVTFKVDMTAVKPISQVGVKGEFTNPPWKEILPLTDTNRDGIYELTVSQTTAVSNVEFKFVHNGIYELLGKDNRKLHFEYKPETLVYEGVFNNPDAKQTNK
ncbi:hypothetical protein [uncultured Dokdonia sp.]|uniref:hypothetical protein n=1 Tax=uncultured Dokdonia sp. TaxID=575653 RepID=UPI002632ACD5|nr:hypothetical protein [uncultured Dokdonia sp.]